MRNRNYQEKLFTESTTEIVQYITAGDGVPREAILYFPKGDIVKRRGFVTYCHAGSKDPMAYLTAGKNWCEFWNSLGYGAGSIDYVDTGDETGQGFTEPEQIQGAINTNVWFRYLGLHHEELGISPKKLFCMGSSAGAYNSLNAAVAFYNLSDPLFASPLNSLYGKRKPLLLGTAGMSGACEPKFRKLFREGGVPNHAFNGVKDPTTNIEWARDTVKAMNAVKILSTLKEYPDDDHTLDGHSREIQADLMLKFAALMGIDPVVPA